MTKFCGLNENDAVLLLGQFHLLKSIAEDCKTECNLQFRSYDGNTKTPVYKVAPKDLCQTCVRIRNHAR